MEHIALYRKYRSRTFDDVQGQDQVTSVLKYQSKTGRVSHAYLFCGSRGTGKTSCAKILAKAVNCENPRDGEPCCECESCLSIDRGAATDVDEMDAASETGVDYIRSIKEEVLYPPALLKKRVYIIDEVHMLSESAFNALLKTLEEPPEHVVFILATTEMHKLPATVISRCQRFDFRRLPVDVLTSRLRYIADREGINLDDSAAGLIARQAQGGMRDAISLFDLCSAGGSDVTEERVKEILGVTGYETVAECSKAIAEKDIAKLFDVVADVASSSKDIAVFWRELSSFFRDMLVCKYAKDPKKYLDLTESDFELLKECAGKFKLAKLFYGSKILDDATRDMVRMPEIKRVTAEFALVKLCDETVDPSNAALTARVEALEAAVYSGAVPPAPKSDAPRAETPAARNAGGQAVKEEARQSAPAAVDENKAAEQKSAPAADIPAPGTQAAYDARFREVPDMSEVAKIVGEKDLFARSLLAEATGYLRDDGGEIRIVTENIFAQTYFTDERKRKIADAFVSLRINDRPVKVEVQIRKKEKELYEKLYDNVQKINGEDSDQ